MGQLQSIVHRRRTLQLESFPDLSNFPPEVAVSVLSHLNATDLCLAACVWKHLADNELLWQRLVVELLYQLFVCTLKGATGLQLDFTKVAQYIHENLAFKILAYNASRRFWNLMLISLFLSFAILLNEKFSGICSKHVKFIQLLQHCIYFEVS